tara:strand:+ start:1431 stop:3533 length:2103 start_codon:yes stop_codon:yes gene_type:complete
MRCLIIDNYDSFTWNLADYVAQIFQQAPIVVKNDELSWQAICERYKFDAIIVSPGPGSVVNVADFHVSREALRQNDIPVLGVCLGHQGLAYLYGGVISHAPEPYHGRSSAVHHNNRGLFHAIPSPFNVIRYHSLIVERESIPDPLDITAQLTDGTVMALQHKHYPKWGVQFHPESILTAHGLQMIENFRDLVADYWQTTQLPTADISITQSQLPATHKQQSLRYREIDYPVCPEKIFVALYGDETNSFWLDSQSQGGENARYSFMGCVEDDAVLQYSLSADDADFTLGKQFLQLLELELATSIVTPAKVLPFDFCGGWIGYFTYEMKTLFGAKTSHVNTIPDALWLKANRFIAFDHRDERAWIVAVDDNTSIAWLDTIAAKLTALTTLEPVESGGYESLAIEMAMNESDYLNAIKTCQDKIVDGESYEICLTNQFSFKTNISPLQLYRHMRRDNPAPFGAFIKSGNTAILSTSPERFIKVSPNGSVETKPMKGTAARDDDLANDILSAQRLADSEKDRAENLMIVDLMRNDLSRVCQPGTVTVPKLMAIESYQTVHQMVSTVNGQLKPTASLVDLLRAVFPGGSITGAPKCRTMEILDMIETQARGVYCGAIGYLGYNRIADLNIGIRSLSFDGETARFGAGGAITYLSQSNDEFAEIMLKAVALLKPIAKALLGNNGLADYVFQKKQLILQSVMTVISE